MSPAVSVVIPTHDRCRMLMRAVRSALRQDLQDIEVIVVDDGSSDDTWDALTGVTDPRLRVIRHERPQRVAAARNAGAEAATGSWLALLDDDDFWAPGKLREQCAAAIAGGREWVYAGVVEVDEDDRVIGGAPPPAPADLLAGLKARNVVPAGCSNVIVRRERFRQLGGFDPGLRHLADWDLWLRLAVTGPPACVTAPLVAYRIHQGQASLDPAGMMAEGRTLHERHGADLNSIRRWLAWSHLRRGERSAAAGVYAAAARSGDLLSLGRALVALVAPNPTQALDRRSEAGDEWSRASTAWVAGVVP